MENWTTVQQALVITGIGISLIFAVLIVMWGLMAALVRITPPRARRELPAQTELPAMTAGDDDLNHAARRGAAVIGVAVPEWGITLFSSGDAYAQVNVGTFLMTAMLSSRATAAACQKEMLPPLGSSSKASSTPISVTTTSARARSRLNSASPSATSSTTTSALCCSPVS